MFVDGRAYPPDSHGELVDSTRVSPGYFDTLGVRLTAGRDFAATDTDTAEEVAIINDTMARRYWPHADPIGRRFRVARTDTAPVRIIGVVASHKLRTMGEAPRPLVVFARSQGYAPSATILARTAGDPRALVAELRQALLRLEPRLVFFEKRDDAGGNGGDGVSRPRGSRTGGWLWRSCAGARYGGLVRGRGVLGRPPDAGDRVRIAVGADPARVIGMVMREGLTLVAIGLVVGGAAALITGRALSSMLYGVGAADPLSFTGAFAVLLVAASAATAVPARRAARLDPTIALRAN